MEIKINLKKKDLYFLTVIFLFLIIIGFVIAYNPSWKTAPISPSIHGHSPDEITNSVLEVDDNIQSYVTNPSRYHITLTSAGISVYKLKPLNHTLLTELCGDLDGCEIRFEILNWITDPNSYKEVSAGVNYLFHYNPSNNQYSIWPRSGSTITDIDNGHEAWDIIRYDPCYFGDYDGYSNGAFYDNSVGFSLLMLNTNGFVGPDTKCEMTIID